jgi:hypothetical protein
MEVIRLFSSSNLVIVHLVKKMTLAKFWVRCNNSRCRESLKQRHNGKGLSFIPDVSPSKLLIGCRLNLVLMYCICNMRQFIVILSVYVVFNYSHASIVFTCLRRWLLHVRKCSI